VDDASVDRVIANSVFTHLLKDEAEWYLREIARVLRPGGIAMLSFFITDHALENAQYSFAYGSNGCRWEHQSSPETAVGYSLEAVEAMLRGVKVKDVRRGTWAGSTGLLYQDLLILERPA
jgi:predicted SAM-dependent methyltransferase